jgi:CheY-like chemotaxis protein
MAPTGARPLVLVVEDEPVIREMLRGALDEAGFGVTTVEMAQQALPAVERDSPDLIVLDLGMPRGTLQGMDFLVLLRERQRWKDLPVLILSGYGDIVNRDIATRLGVRMVLSKPLTDLAVLVNAVRQQLPRSAP